MNRWVLALGSSGEPLHKLKQSFLWWCVVALIQRTTAVHHSMPVSGDQMPQHQGLDQCVSSAQDNKEHGYYALKHSQESSLYNVSCVHQWEGGMHIHLPYHMSSYQNLWSWVSWWHCQSTLLVSGQYFNEILSWLAFIRMQFTHDACSVLSLCQFIENN